MADLAYVEGRGEGPRAKHARKILGRFPKSAGHTPL